ncbi:hypothetical protein PR001_g20319 [Phytophthora rubi]|uniref:Clp R domain-containing protein n=1 Tax=Phytophthora rubi TaxID=129364 RepID=A0A6A3JMQ0_9STRA|nr:hypothetical protein PR001_g20319 [Phytophthora rubi]
MAEELGHSQLTPLHMVHALFEDRNGTTKRVVDLVHGNVAGFQQDVMQQLKKMPSQTPAPDSIGADSALVKILNLLKSNQMDEKLVKDAVSNVCGGRPVPSASAEENYDALNKYGG